MVQPQIVERMMDNKTALVSVMYANNEIGTINPIRKIAEVCHQHNVLFHTDAVQAVPYLPVDVHLLGVDLLSLGAHKFYGPKGIGALYVRKGTPLIPSQTGGGQENNLRAGTQNVPYIVGLAEALRLTVEEREQRIAHVKPLRDQIIGAILETIPDSRLTGHMETRLPNHASFAFKDVDGNLLLTLLDAAGFACSSGSACKTGNPEPSEVMEAIGLSREWGLGSLRITLGVNTTVEEIDSFIRTLPSIISKARELSE
jgi:cysteine desulfurase